MKAALAALIVAAQGPLADPGEEARAQALMREIRCVACENEPISQSSAEIAEDMRAKVRELVAAGADDSDVRAWFADRYGDFVLFRPPARGLSGVLLWGLPFLALLCGAALVAALRRRGEGDGPVTVPPERFDHEAEKDL